MTKIIINIAICILGILNSVVFWGQIVPSSTFSKTFEPSFFKSQIIKVAPSLDQEQFIPKFRGIKLAYETSIGLQSWSSNWTVRLYNYQPLVNDTITTVKASWQVRLWTTHLMRRFYLAPEISYYTHQDWFYGNKERWKLGIFLGFQGRILRHLTWELATGIQQTSPIENYIQPFFIRFDLNIGWIIRQ